MEVDLFMQAIFVDISGYKMKAPLFEYPSYSYQINDWEFKKKGLLKRIDEKKLIRTELQTFESDRQTNNKIYVRYLSELLHDELSEFCKEAEITCSMTDAWCVKYQKGDQQTIHNHRGWGFSGILYVEFDPKVHTPTCFVAPWQNPRTDTTILSLPATVEEGTMIIFPSYTLHFVHPNSVRKQRTVISFDLLPNLPEQQTLNKKV